MATHETCFSRQHMVQVYAEMSFAAPKATYCLPPGVACKEELSPGLKPTTLWHQPYLA